MFSFRPSEAGLDRWILGMAFFRKYYAIFDLTPENTRIGLVGGKLPAGTYTVEKDSEFVLPDFWGSLILICLTVCILFALLCFVCRACCSNKGRKRYALDMPVIKKPTPQIRPAIIHTPAKPIMEVT
jgi:hypothetical protein